jgi:hypothetical protein
MIIAWVLTFPACLVLGYISASIFRWTSDQRGRYGRGVNNVSSAA